MKMLADVDVKGKRVLIRVDFNVPQDKKDPSKITNTLAETTKAKIISTRIRVARNLSMFPLNPGGTGDTRTQVCEMMKKVYDGLEGELEGVRRRVGMRLQSAAGWC